MREADDRIEMLHWRAALKRELRAVEHALHLVPEGSRPVPRGVRFALLELVAEYSLDLISVHNQAGDFVYVSPNVRQLFGWEAIELEGCSPYEFIHPDDLKRAEAAHAACAEGQDESVRYRLRGPSGQYRWAESRSRMTGEGSYIVSITRDVQREQTLLQELERRSTYDVLTSLLNRRGMEEAMAGELERSRRQDAEAALLYFDVDRFKQINDTEGHAAGDDVLRRIGAVVNACKRISDHAARWGGDEFLLLLPETSAVEAVRVARRIGRGVTRAMPGVTLSAGIATTRQAPGAADLLRRSDEALYSVKRQGGGWVAVAGCGLPLRPAQDAAEEPAREAEIELEPV